MRSRARARKFLINKNRIHTNDNHFRKSSTRITRRRNEMKIDKDHIIGFLKQRKDFLQKEYGVISISLFGSYARGEETEESDIDFFVEMPADYDKLFDLKEYLEKSFQRSVDVVRKHSNIRQRFLEEIEKDGVYV